MSEPTTVKKDNKAPAPGQRLAVVRVRGQTGILKGIKDTLTMLSLPTPNSCTVVDSNMLGMVMKVKDYVTWGEIDDETFKVLVEKRAEKYAGRTTDRKGIIQYNKFITFNNQNYKKFFRLSPPRGGYERKGIKTPFSMGGALGYRKENINELLRKMM